MSEPTPDRGAPREPVIDDGERATILRRDGLMVGIAAAGLTSGMHFSPYFDYAHIPLRYLAAGLFLTSPLVTLYLTSLFVATIAIAVAGIPAALYERSRNLAKSDVTSLTIWLVCALVIATPALLAMSGTG